MSEPDRLIDIKRRLSATPPNDVRDMIDRELFAEVARLRDELKVAQEELDRLRR